jgi:hypothetical protein
MFRVPYKNKLKFVEMPLFLFWHGFYCIFMFLFGLNYKYVGLNYNMLYHFHVANLYNNIIYYV